MSEYGEKSAVMSTFKDGLVMDMNPMASKNTTLSDALNATFVTMRGNELVLQNDYGNGRIEKAYLPPGYIPIGMKEYGGIIYIASYNPLTNKGLVGSFPSPERNIDSQELSTDEKKISWENFIDSSYEEKKSCSTFIAKLDIFGDKIIHSGDKYTIYFKDGSDPESLKYLSNYFNTTEDTYTKVTSPKNNTLTIKLAVVDSENNLRDITELCRRFDKAGDVIQFDINSSPVLKFNSGYFIQDPTVEINKKDYTSHSNEDFITERNKKAVNTYNNKISGLVYLIVELNVVQAFNVSTKAFKAGENGEFSKYAKKYILDRVPEALISDSDLYLILFEFNYKYNCPDGYYRNGVTPSKDDELILNNPMLSGYSSYFGNNSAANILGTFIKHSVDKLENLLTFDDERDGELIPWECSLEQFPEYDTNTGLYSKTQYKVIALRGVSSDQKIFNYYCEPAMSYSRMPQLAVLGSVDLSLIGTNAVDITAWRYYNDDTTNQTHLVVGIQESLPDNCSIINSYYEVFDIDNIDLNDIKPTFTLQSQRSSYNGEYQEIYSLRNVEDNTALVWDHLYLAAVIVDIEQLSESGEIELSKEILGYRYFLGTKLFNTCFFNNSKVFAKDYMESFWNDLSNSVDLDKYIFGNYEFDGVTYYSNFKENYDSIFSIPLELNTNIGLYDSQKLFRKLAGAKEWTDGNIPSTNPYEVAIYENRITGKLRITNVLNTPDLNYYPNDLRTFGDIVNGGYNLLGTEHGTRVTWDYPNLKKDCVGTQYKPLITNIEAGRDVELYDDTVDVYGDLNNKFKIDYSIDKDYAKINIDYDLQYLSELFGQYKQDTINFKSVYRPFLTENKKGFLDSERFFPLDSCKSLDDLYPKNNLGKTDPISLDFGGTPLIYWPSFDDTNFARVFQQLITYSKYWPADDAEMKQARIGGQACGWGDYSPGYEKSYICIGPNHNLLEGGILWRIGNGATDGKRSTDRWSRKSFLIFLDSDYKLLLGVSDWWKQESTIRPLSAHKDTALAAGGTNVFMSSYASTLNLDLQSLLTWRTITYTTSNDGKSFNRFYYPSLTGIYNKYKIQKNSMPMQLEYEAGNGFNWQISFRSIDEAVNKFKNIAVTSPRIKKTFSLDVFSGSANKTLLCFRTDTDSNLWANNSSNMRKIDISELENYIIKKHFGTLPDNPKNRRLLTQYLKSADNFFGSSLYLKTLHDYLNLFCVLSSESEWRTMSFFDSNTTGGVLDYSHKLDIISNLVLELNEEELTKATLGKCLNKFMTKLYTNTSAILNNSGKFGESLPKLLSSMWFVLPKSLNSSITKTLNFNLQGTSGKIDSFVDPPERAVLTDDGQLLTRLYDGNLIPSLGDLAVLGLRMGLLYPPSGEYPDLYNIKYVKSFKVLRYAGEILDGDLLELGDWAVKEDYTKPHLACRLHHEYEGCTLTVVRDIDATFAGLDVDDNNKSSDTFTPKLIPLTNLPYLRECLIAAINKYYGEN